MNWGDCAGTWRTRCDAIAVERLFLWELYSLTDRLIASFLDIQSRSETSSTLLIHLGTRSNSINCHEEKLLRLYLSKQMFDVVEYANKHFFFAEPESGILASIFVRTVMDDTIHVKLKGEYRR